VKAQVKIFGPCILISSSSVLYESLGLLALDVKVALLSLRILEVPGSIPRGHPSSARVS